MLGIDVGLLVQIAVIAVDGYPKTFVEEVLVMQALGTTASDVAADAAGGGDETEFLVGQSLSQNFAPEDFVVLVLDMDGRSISVQFRFGLEALGGKAVEIVFFLVGILRSSF